MDGSIGGAGEGTFLQGLSRDLTQISVLLAGYAEGDAKRGLDEAGRRASVGEVRAAIAGERARASLFDVPLAHPGWNLLLALFLARLEGRGLYTARLAAEAGVSDTTALRWLDRIEAAGLIRRETQARPAGRVAVSLTDAGAEAMHAWFGGFRSEWGRG